MKEFHNIGRCLGMTFFMLLCFAVFPVRISAQQPGKDEIIQLFISTLKSGNEQRILDCTP